jgi:fumarylpyruvate hydrolase
MGGEVGRDPPFFFMKPADSLVTDGRFPYPSSSLDVHHELELVVALGEDLEIFGYAVGLDMTRRDLQATAKKLGRPWDAAKGFDFSAPVAPLVPARQAGAIDRASMTLTVNNVLRQKASTADMIWRIPEIISELSKLFALKPGDLVFTGTPAGVGAVQRGDRLEAAIDGLVPFDVTVT